MIPFDLLRSLQTLLLFRLGHMCCELLDPHFVPYLLFSGLRYAIKAILRSKHIITVEQLKY